MVEEKAVEVPSRIMTPLMMVIIAAVAALLSAFSITVTAFSPTWVGGSTFTPGNIGLIILSILLLLSGVTPQLRKVDAKLLTILWVTFTVTVMYSYGVVPMALFDAMLASRTYNPMWRQWFSILWGPSLEVARLQLKGGALVPWGEYMPALLGWILLALLWWLFIISLMSIYRRQWMDVEALPYPASYTGSELILDLSKAEERKGRRMLLLIGGLIGFLIFLPQALKNVFPWFPDIYGLAKDPWISWALFTIDTTKTPLKGTLVGLNGLQLNPSAIAFAYLIPTDILFSAIVSNVFFMIVLPQIAYYFGYYSTALTVSDVVTKRDVLGQGAPFYYYAMASYGMAPAVILVWIVLNWRYIIQTFKWVRRPDPKVDAEEPIPFRLSYIILFASIALLFAANVVIGATSMAGALIIIFVHFLHNSIRARSAGYGGPWMGDWMEPVGWINWMYAGVTSSTVTAPMVNDYLMINRPQNILNWNNADTMIMFRIAKTTGTNLRDVALAMMIAMVVSAAVSFPLALQIRHTFGSKILRGLYVDGWWMYMLHDPTRMINYPAPGFDWVWSAIAGGIVIAAVYVARMLWFKFPLEPIGVWAGVAGVNTFILTSWTIAYVLKKITFKIGGVPLWENKGLPLAVGVMVGWNLALFLSGVLGIVRFFFPF
ncbi:MAG: DUF6785 family protein [Thermoproteota archaeon]